MADKQSIAEAVSSIRKYRKLVRKSLGGIERQFYYDIEPKKALTSSEGTAIMNPESVPVAVPMGEVQTEESRERRGRPRKEKKETTVKDKVAKIENNLGKVRVKRNTMMLYL